jgi:hypothetical protein
MVMKVLIVVFWAATPCSFVCGYKCFRGNHITSIFRAEVQFMNTALLKMEEMHSSKTLVTMYEVKQRHN